MEANCFPIWFEYFKTMCYNIANPYYARYDVQVKTNLNTCYQIKKLKNYARDNVVFILLCVIQRKYFTIKI